MQRQISQENGKLIFTAIADCPAFNKSISSCRSAKGSRTLIGAIFSLSLSTLVRAKSAASARIKIAKFQFYSKW